MDESIWPARNVAEYAYCPRLFYFMAVEGVFISSHDTEEGARVHKRVDKPSNAPISPADAPAQTDEHDDSQRPLSVRSFALTSQRLGVTAKLDLAQITGKCAVPVEYRKGRPQRFGKPNCWARGCCAFIHWLTCAAMPIP